MAKDDIQVAPATEAQHDLLRRLLEIQSVLKVEKGQYNSFGKYSYRSKEDILEAAKPLCFERGLLLLVNDAIECMPNGWTYVVSTASITDVDTGETFFAKGYAREPQEKKGADASQITGMAASYAGKRALGNLFSIDDTKDSDGMPASSARAPRQPPAQGPFTARCRSCGTAYEFQDAEQFRYFKEHATCCPAPAWEVG